MWVLADHEGLYELSRLRGAAVVGVLLLAAAATLTWLVLRGDDGPWYRRPAGPLAAAGVSATVVAVALGMIPRETSNGSIICGPVLHERVPDPSCREVLASPRSVVLVFLIAAAAAFVGAAAARVSRSVARVDQRHQ